MMIANKEILAEKREELVGVLTAISVVSKKLAGQLSMLEHRQSNVQKDTLSENGGGKGGESFGHQY